MTGPRISVLCPTRNRPGNVERLVTTAVTTAARAVEFVFYCDNDASGSVSGQVRAHPWVTVIQGDRITLSDMWNVCWREATADVFMLCGDDIAFRTPAWDDIVLDAFAGIPDRVAFVHGRDGLRHDDFGTHGFLHRNWTDAVGYFTPRGFSCDWVDTWINELANDIGRRVVVDIETEHCHPNAGKATWDQTHEERRQRDRRDNNQALYADRRYERLADAMRLRAEIEAAACVS